jgi:hypothetical protein
MHDSNKPQQGSTYSDNQSPASSDAAAEARACGGEPHPAPSGGYTTTGSPLSGGASPSVEVVSPGAPPSNTAPANYNENPKALSETRLLRFGIDSLYLSYPGKLASAWAQRLEGLKRAAQATEEGERSNAQVKIGGHLFEVKDKGKGRFAYVLVDNCFHIQVSSGQSSAFPMAYVQLSSELLTAIPVHEAEAHLRYIVNTLGRVESPAQISRADLFADVVSSLAMDGWRQDAWVMRAHKIWMHYEKRRFSGWSIGLGGTLGARLYNKTLELDKSKKDYLKPLWAACGWREGETVWRLEFEFKRDVLRELGILALEDLPPNLGGLWRYATETWLRLTVPNPDDSNQTRWPNHPLWNDLSSIPWSGDTGQPLGRVRKERLPSDESLFINGLGGLTSFMARHGITDLGEGFGEFLAHAERFHDSYQRQSGKDFKGYVLEKVSAKGRKYNTLENRNKETERDERERTRKDAHAYRKAKDGE